ncbi:MAG: hypothetical protein ABI644_01140 [Arenimonas sp.]
MPTPDQVTAFNNAALPWDEACEEYDAALRHVCIGTQDASQALDRALVKREIASAALELAGIPFESK